MTASNGTNGTFAESLTVLTEQIGRLTEVVTGGFADLKDGMSDLKALVREQAETSKRQEQHISRLVDTAANQEHHISRLAETAASQEHHISRLAETAASQEHHISRLVDTVARQAEVVEALIRDRQQPS